MDQLSPKTDIPSRIKLRDEIIRKIYTNVEDVVNLFLSYELNYFDVILIISIPQYSISVAAVLRNGRKSSTVNRKCG